MPRKTIRLSDVRLAVVSASPKYKNKKTDVFYLLSNLKSQNSTLYKGRALVSRTG